MVEVSEADKAANYAEEDVYSGNTEGDHHAAQQAGRLRILEQQRVETAFDDHDKDQDRDRLFDILLDVGRAFLELVAEALLEACNIGKPSASRR